MNRRLLIAFTGYKGSGKDTAAEVLTELWGYQKVAFADPIRMISREVFGFTDEELSDRLLKEQAVDRWPNQSPRQVMKTIGTEMFREYYPDVWIKCAEQTIDKVEAEGKGVVMTDLRFANEETFVRSRGGIIVRVHRFGTDPTDPHPSEAYISKILPHFELVNDSPNASAFKAKVIDFVFNHINNKEIV